MIQRPNVTTLNEAKAIHKVHCGECNWEQIIAAETSDELKCCPWCGWSDLEMSAVDKQGGYQDIHCEKHGRVSVILPGDNIVPEDFEHNLWCPFCE